MPILNTLPSKAKSNRTKFKISSARRQVILMPCRDFRFHTPSGEQTALTIHKSTECSIGSWGVNLHDSPDMLSFALYYENNLAL